MKYIFKDQQPPITVSNNIGESHIILLRIDNIRHDIDGTTLSMHFKNGDSVGWSFPTIMLTDESIPTNSSVGKPAFALINFFEAADIIFGMDEMHGLFVGYMGENPDDLNVMLYNRKYGVFEKDHLITYL